MPGPQRINPIGNEWNPPAARFGPPAPPPPPPPPPPSECTCNVESATLFEQGAALGTSAYAMRSARLSGDALGLVVPLKASTGGGFSGGGAIYARVAAAWSLVTTITGAGINDGADDIIGALSGDAQRAVLVNQAGPWPAGLTNVYGFELQAGSYVTTNDGFPITGELTPTGLPTPPGVRQYSAAVLDSTGASLFMIGIDGDTDMWVVDRFDWAASGAPVTEGWLYAQTFNPWPVGQSSPAYAFNAVISGDDTHIAVRRASSTTDGISVLTQVAGDWVESFTYDAIVPGGYAVPLSLGPDGTCMLVAEAATSAGPFTIWLTERGAGSYTRSAQLPGSFTDAPLHASEDYGMLLFADEATPDVETFISNIVCDTTPAAITLAAPSPASGYVGDASGNFTVTGARLTESVVVTPASSLAGTLAPTTVTIGPGDLTKTFTLTPSAEGVHSVSITNDGGITNPSPVDYTVTTAPPAVEFVLDTFTGAAGNLGAHVGEVGATWTDLFGNDGGTLYQLTGSGAVGGLVGDSRYMACSGLPAGYPYDLGCTLTFSSPSDVQDSLWAILFAYDSNDGNGFGIQVSLEYRDRGAGGKTINASMYAAVSGSGSTAIARVDNIAPLDTPFELRFEAEADALTVNLLVDGVQIATLTRPSVAIPLTAYCGFRLLQTGDNAALMSEFSGNDL